MTEVPAVSVDRLVITVTGRPAPQGSKRLGQHGQMLEQSRYLPAWRAAVKRCAYRAFREAGIEPEALPLFTGPISVEVTFYLTSGQLSRGRIDGPPDLDKLMRSTWDALTEARVWLDDGQVVHIVDSRKVLADGFTSGAVIVVRQE